MPRLFLPSILAVLASMAAPAGAAVAPITGGYEVTYEIGLNPGSSNGNDIQDVLIFEWNSAGDFNADGGFTIAGRGATSLRHTVGFEPTAALVIGWGAGIAGIGDEKDHLFTLVNRSFAANVTGKKWSEAFPGVPPEPRTGHNAMIGLLQAASGGDSAALDSIAKWVRREAEAAAFDPDGPFRVMEWTDGKPIDGLTAAIPTLSIYGLSLLILSFVFLGRRFGRR